MALLWPAEDALLATAVDAEQRPHAFAVRHATLNAGFSVGGLLAALVVGFASKPGTVSTRSPPIAGAVIG